MLAGRLAALRLLRAADRITSVRWRNDPDIRDNVLGYRFPVTEAMEADWVDAVLKDQPRTRFVLAIEDKTDGALVGFVLSQQLDWSVRNAEFGILIGRAQQTWQGACQGGALCLVAGCAFETLNLHKLYLRSHSIGGRWRSTAPSASRRKVFSASRRSFADVTTMSC